MIEVFQQYKLLGNGAYLLRRWKMMVKEKTPKVAYLYVIYRTIPKTMFILLESPLPHPFVKKKKKVVQMLTENTFQNAITEN